MSVNKTAITPATEETLKKLDWILVVDHSGSTNSPSTRMKGKTRYEEMREQAILAAQVAGKYDDDGITVIYFSSHAKVKDNVTAYALADVFKEFPPNGSTNLAEALEKAVEKAKSSTKETVVIVFTDGEANDFDAVVKIMNQAGKDLGRPRIGFAFVQVGDDAGAKAFLDKLDNGLAVDVCATFSQEDAENITIEQLVTAAREE